MLIIGTLIVIGFVGLFLARTRWRLPRSGILAIPLVSGYALWNLAILPVVLMSVLTAYGCLSVGHRRLQLRERWFLPLAIGGGVLPVALGSGIASAYLGLNQLFDTTLLLGGVLASIVSYEVYRIDSPHRRAAIGAALLGLGVLFSLGVVLTWLWITPPCVSCQVLSRPLAASVPSLLLASGADVLAVLSAIPVVIAMLLAFIPWLSLLATGVGTVVFMYVLASMVGHILYTDRRGVKKVEDLTVVVVTIATEDVREALLETIDHNRTLLAEYDFYVLIDEGAELQPKLEAMNVDLIVVPEEYSSEAIAKGRAMQYFVDHYVTPNEWYAFLDDDNLLQGREFLYEIPKREAEGKLVMNPILVPRQGESLVPFVIDHMRTLFDFTVFRTFTGLLGRPHAGLHGELLCARGDILREIGFDRETIVEDFAFADELVQRGIPTWQSRTTTSILSPHSIRDYFTQRTRWFSGKVRWLPHCSRGTQVVTGVILGVWMLGIFGGWLVGGIWFLFGPPAHLVYLAPALLSAALYGGIYAIGIARTGTRNLPKVLFIPLYATVEHLAPYYAMIKRSDSFNVIKK